MEKVYIHPDIFYIENFLTDQELSNLVSESLEDNWEDYTKQMTENLKANWANKLKRMTNQENIKSMYGIRTRIIDELGEKYSHLQLSNSRSIKRYRVGDLDRGGKYALNPHHDGIKHPWQLGFIIYLNDDFEGGEITYENLGISLKAKPGTLVVHKANDDCTHRVEAVTNGTRYMITFFAGDPADPMLEEFLPKNDK
jgi:predicted 2-oxoglutarate/Fe(II)-dependent dioxygenase YbiX